MKKLLIVDGNSLVNRAYFALPPLQTKSGVYTGGVHGFLTMLESMLQREKPTHVVVTFDRKEKTFRHKRFEGYKANRKGMPDELAMQMPVLKEILDALGLMRMEKAGYEADDLMGTLSRKAAEEGVPSVILTGDKDTLQLVNEQVTVALPKRGISELNSYGVAEVIEEIGLTPEQVVDEMGLRGDPSDNIPGVKGIGVKTALNLLQGGRHLEDVYEDPGDVTPRIKKLLEEGKEDAFLSRELATIMLDVPMDFHLDACSYQGLDVAGALDLLKKYELNSIIRLFSKDLDLDQGEEATELEIEEKKPSLRGDIIYYSYEDYHAVKEEGKRYVFQGEIDFSKVDHLLAYDLKKLYLDGYTLPEKVDDLMISHYLVHPDLRSSTAAELLRITPPKTPMDLHQFLASMLDGMEELQADMEKQLEEQGMLSLYREIEVPLIPVLAAIEQEGFKVDQEALDEQDEFITSSLKETEETIYSFVKEPFNINSPKQLGVILFEELGLPVIKKTKTGYSTNREVLDRLQGRHPIIDSILHYRTLAKIKGTYIDGLRKVIEEDGKIHTSLNQTVAVTGRLSSTEPNLQNIPIRFEEGRRIRKIFVPSDEDHILLSADYSQIELRILAHLSQDEAMIQGYQKDEDIHRITASKVFGIPLDEVSSHQRREAKAVNFGIVYGISDFGLSENIDIPIAAAKDYIEKYFDFYPGVKAYLDGQVELAKEEGYVTTMMGRRRNIPEINSRNFHLRNFAKRTAMNTPIQGSAADIIKLAMIHVADALKKEGLESKMILQVHDELIFDVKKDELEQVKKLVKDKMNHVVELSVPLEISMDEGESWYEI